MTDGFAPTSDIDVTAIGSVPFGHTTIAPVFAWRLAIVVVTTNARLTKIVEPRPNDVADDVRIVVHECPVLEGIARIAFCLPHHTLRITLMVAGVLEYHIVITTNVEYIKVWVKDFPIVVPGAESLGYGASGVIIQNSLLQQLSGMDYTDVLALDNLVADAPADDAWMIAVTLHHRTYILSIARIDKRRIVVWFLGCTPTVEGLADDQHTQ